MLGRDLFLQSLLSHGVNHIFGNPGTTENPLLDGLSKFPKINYITCLHEAVAVSAASYYTQALGRSSAVNLHAAPGLGNAIGAMYGALKANSPLIVTAGQQDTRMRLRDPLLSHDLVSMAQPVTKWSIQAERADEIAEIMVRALKIANDPPQGPVFVSLPIDVMATPSSAVQPSISVRGPTSPAGQVAIDNAASMVLECRSPALIVGDGVARDNALEELVALSEATGSPVWWENLRSLCPFPNDHPNARGSLPFDTAGIRKALGESDLVLVIGGPAMEQVWFSEGNLFPLGAKVLQVEETEAKVGRYFHADVALVGPVRANLALLTKELLERADGEYREGAQLRNVALREAAVSDRAAAEARVERLANVEPMPAAVVMSELADLLPENASIVDDSISANVELGRFLKFRAAQDYFGARGGGIGQALPGAIGIQLAYPERRVVAVSGDGSAMYGIQALWTAAHYSLPITFLILGNGEYRVLKHNADTYRQRFEQEQRTDHPYTDLKSPTLSFEGLARAMGVAASRATNRHELRETVSAALAAGGPYLVEVVVAGKG